MDKPLRFHPLVVADLEAAISWYERLSPEAAAKFRRAVDQSFRVITQSPRQYAIVIEHRSMRLCHLKPFPYVVIYRELPDCVRILGIRHAASDTAAWSSRE